ncbi:MAG: response regulator [Alphaproteobacteria bacterium]|nr:response regulator [Alphaproteobacteria bacterium]
MTKTCLIVDDSRVVRKVARRIVEDLGFACEEAENGKLALESCEKSMPSAVLLDWNMPVMDGIEFLRRLRDMKEGKSPAVIFCTVENTAGRVRQALEAGASEYIMKPFDGEIIQSKFRLAGLIE